MNLYTEQDSNVRKTWFLMTMFLVVVVGIGWFVSYFYDSPIILVFAIVFSVGMNIFSYYNSDKIVLKMYKANQITRESHRELWNSVENLSITAGLPMPRVFVIPDPAPNAFATGRDKDHAAVAVTSGLLDMMDRNELDGVIAHELSHIGNRDILLMTVVVVLVGFVSIMADILLRSGMSGGGDNNKSGGVLAIVGVVLVVLSPIFAKIIQLSVSRKREFLADSSGALLTRYPEGLASALEKLGSYSGKMQKANQSTAHMFISNPFGAKAKKGFSKLFLTHPPIEDRIAKLRGME